MGGYNLQYWPSNRRIVANGEALPADTPMSDRTEGEAEDPLQPDRQGEVDHLKELKGAKERAKWKARRTREMYKS